MNCIHCAKREATTNDLFCQICADILRQEDQQRWRDSLLGQHMLAYKSYCELKQAIKTELLKPLRRFRKEG